VHSNSPVLLREEMGRRLRAARDRAGITLDEAAKELYISKSGLNRIEKGHQRADIHLLRSMMDLYNFRDDELVEMAKEAGKRGWWRDYGVSDQDFVALEAGAIRECVFEVQLVPGLLQTADYARALFESGRTERSQEWVADRLNVRLIRQDRLTDEEQPLELTAVIDENALRQPVGGPSLMRAQLSHLALVSELPTVAVHILPTSVLSNEGLYGNFTLLDFAYRGQPSMAYVSHALGEARYADPSVLDAARLRFEHLRSLALDPHWSVARIEQVANELWSC
jgi:transcriptional regulator with XRE-family HTH domain